MTLMEICVNSYWMFFGLTLPPAAGDLASGLLARFFETNKGRLSKALHAAAGIIIAIVSIELMPEALARIPSWWVAGVVIAELS